MNKKEINARKVYLESLKSDLTLNDNAAVMSEMTQRAKQVEGILKALVSANINHDNIPGITIFTEIDKNLTVKKYLKDLFFFDTMKLTSNGTDKFLVAEANLFKFAKGENMSTKDKKNCVFLRNFSLFVILKRF